MASVSAPPLAGLQRILVTTDFSPPSRMALKYAAALARREQGKIFLAHVVPLEPLSPIPMDAGPGVLSVPRADARERLEQEVSQFAGVQHELLVRHGDFWPAIENIIENRQIEAVVIGTHGREGLGKLLLGSAAEQVFRRASCPVITIGPHVSEDCLHEGNLRHLLFTTDLSSFSQGILGYVHRLAKEEGARVTFLHVISVAVAEAMLETSNYLQGVIDEARRKLEHWIPEAAPADVMVEVGMPSSVITRVARSLDTSLIIMGLHPQSVFAATHLPWTTAHRVICDAHCPVMTVR